jgi:hypothetical protein
MFPRWMRAAAVCVLAFVAGCATYVPVAPPPSAPPTEQPPVTPPTLPPTQPPTNPPVTPPEAPVSIKELVARLAVGSTVTEANEVFGRSPDNISPAFGPAPETRRWYVMEGDQQFAVFAVMRNAKVSSAGFAKVERIP